VLLKSKLSSGRRRNLAARLEGIAKPNMVVIAENTRKLLGNMRPATGTARGAVDDRAAPGRLGRDRQAGVRGGGLHRPKASVFKVQTLGGRAAPQEKRSGPALVGEPARRGAMLPKPVIACVAAIAFEATTALVARPWSV
jgi:hypothetical protein